jgi:hypothetical protein
MEYNIICVKKKGGGVHSYDIRTITITIYRLTVNTTPFHTRKKPLFEHYFRNESFAEDKYIHFILISNSK